MNDTKNKLLDFQKKVGAIAKEEVNPFFNSKYFDINGLIETIKPILNECELTLTQPIQALDGKNILNTFLKHGERIIESSSITLPENLDPQKMGSAITYFRRYAIQSMLLLQAEDDDANKAAGHKPTETTEPAAFEQMRNAKSIEDIKRIWNKNKSLQSDNAFLGLSKQKKAEIIAKTTVEPPQHFQDEQETEYRNNEEEYGEKKELKRHPLNPEPEKFTPSDILGEVEEAPQTETFITESIAKLSKAKTVTGLNSMFKELRNNAAYLFLDESEKNEIIKYCQTKKSEINGKK